MSKVELSDNTTEILKNFAMINSNVLLEPGQILRTVAETKDLFAVANIEEEFPCEFGIYDLQSFLGILSLFQKPVLNFSDDKTDDGCARYVVVSDKDGKGKFKYFASAKENLTFIKKNIKMPPTKVEFSLSKVMLQKCIKVTNMAQLPHFAVTSGGKNIDIVLTDRENKSSNEYTVPVKSKGNGDKFDLIIASEKLKMILGDYDVMMDGRVINCFKHKDRDLEYYITSEEISKYG